jgi:acyl-ACP thioesterase
MPASSAVDITKSLRVSEAFNYCQEIAGLHADNLGAGIDRIKEAFDVAWIVMRMRLEVNRPAHLEEPLVIETLPQPPKIRYDRDYLIKAERDGEILARANSSWILMNLTTHDITKGKVFDYACDIRETPRAIDCRLRQLKAPGPLAQVAERVVTYTDIDYNLHVNNARYIDFIMDCYPIEFHQQYEVGAIEVNYISEIRPGETLAISKAAYPDVANTVNTTDERGVEHAGDVPTEYVELSSATDGRTALKAAIEFRKRK